MRILPLARRARELERTRRGADPRTPKRARWVTLAIVFVLTVLITSPTIWMKRPPVEEGRVLERPIVAQVGFEYRSPTADEDWRTFINNNYERVYVYDSRIESNALETLRQVLAAAAQADPEEPETVAAAVRQADERIAQWPRESLAALAKLADDLPLRERLVNLLEQIYQYNIIIDSPFKNQYRRDREARVARTRFLYRPPRSGGFDFQTHQLLEYPEETAVRIEDALKEVFADSDPELFQYWPAALRLLETVLKPSFTFSDAETNDSFESFTEKHPKESFTTTYEVDDVLVGEVVPHEITENEAHLLRAYSEALNQALAVRFLVEIGYILIAFWIISFFVRKFSREFEFTTQTLLLLSLPVLLALGLGRVSLLLAEELPNIGYAFPAGVIGILGVLLLDVRLALLLVTWGCLLFGLEANLEFEYVIVGLFGGYTGVAALYTFRERREVLYAGIFIGSANFMIILIISYIQGWVEGAVTAAVFGLLSGFMCALISFAALPLFEVLFQITTDMRLLELTGLQHPLLRRLEDTAPGTWQHTLNVTKLAEAAASDIGVNYLLIRAGCYFHDIGKMAKPEYFTENQTTPEQKRRHFELKPQMSTLIIRNHIKEGLEMAVRYKLPKVITDFIPQHHGTSIIRYFYQKALDAYEGGEEKEPVREDDYRYPGPKPQSIETAIVMLADSVEATATAKLTGRTVRDEDIQQIVHSTVLEKFNDGQFDECNLTLRDLNRIRESFVKTLRSRYHGRIDYPAPRKEAAPKQPKPKEERPAEADAEKGPHDSRSREDSHVATAG